MLNLTAHSVSIFNDFDCHLDSQNRKLIVNTGAEPVLTVPAGEVVNIKFTTSLVRGKLMECLYMKLQVFHMLRYMTITSSLRC